jgi:hypothetical protein
VSGRHFHFALEFSDDAFSDAAMGEIVASILRHAGLSADEAREATARIVEAARGGAPGRCRVEFEGGVDEVAIVVAHGGTVTWRAARAVE